jgi:hypothetical protein
MTDPLEELGARQSYIRGFNDARSQRAPSPDKASNEEYYHQGYAKGEED